MSSEAATARSPRIAFVLEQSLGHVTHGQNLKRALGESGLDLEPIFLEPAYADLSQRWAQLPVVRSNWSVRASTFARIGLRQLNPQPDSALFHTQITSLFSVGFMKRVPSIISLDATPLQYDSMGALYDHATDENAAIAGFKKRMNERAFAAARQLITWSEWAKAGLSEYGVPAEKVTVIPPGVDLNVWDFSAERADARLSADSNERRLLFVGGDFERKGGNTLMDAFARLPKSLNAQLDVVTRADKIPGEGELPGLHVHRGVTPNSEMLRRLFARADAFVFPSEGDCLPLAVLEALAAGLPIISCNIGAIPEAVRDGETGKIVPLRDSSALSTAIVEIVSDREHARAFGAAARRLAERHYDASQNYVRVVKMLFALAAHNVGGKEA